MEGRAASMGGAKSRSCRKPCRSMASASTSQQPPRDLRRSTTTCQLALPSIFVVVLAIAFVPTAAEAGAMGGRNVPWWYPLREWVFGTDGLDNDAGEMGWTVGSVSRRIHRKKAFVAKEFVENCVALGLGEDEQSMEAMPQCSIHEVTNKTLRRLGESIDECASPYYRLTEIHPSQLVYTEVDPAAEAAEKKRREEEEGRRKRSSEGEEKGKAVEKAGAAVDGAEEQLPDLFLGIFVFLKGDFFSVELENALTAIAPSYPEAWVVKADATVFLSFCVQYHLYTFPQLLLFKNGRLVSKYRGRRSIEELAAWFSLNTGHLPKAIPLRASPHPPRRHPLSLPGMDEPLTWAALLYAATKIVRVTAWFLKRRRGEAGTRRGAGRGTGGLAGRIGRVGRWLAGALIRRVRGGGGQGRRRAAVEPDDGLREDDLSVREGT